MPRNAGNVPSNDPAPHPVEDGGKKRSERLRARRDEAGLAQVSGWVPKDRRVYAREVLAAVSQGSNSLPPDPEQAAALEAAQTAATTARIAETAACEALVVAQQHGLVLAAELDATRTELAVARAEIEAVRDTGRQAETAALAQAEAAEAKALLALATVEQFQKVPGLRGRAIRWLAR